MRFIIILLIVFPFCGYSQNLVPNSDFIDSSCIVPCESPDQFCLANWFSPTNNTPDYYTPCYQNLVSGWCGYNSTSMIDLPSAGIIVYSNTNNVREYISVKLIDTLELNATYKIEFYIKFCKFSEKAIDIVSMYIGDSIFQSNLEEIAVIPQINSPSGIFITDTLNWYKITGNYIADGTESFIIIGNFKDDTSTNTLSVPWGSDIRSYYLIDNVSIIKIEDTIFNEFQFYPNPNNGNFTIDYNLGLNSSGCFKIYNAIGQIVYQSPITQNIGSQNFELNLSAGMYFLSVESNNEIIKNDKFIVVK